MLLLSSVCLSWTYPLQSSRAILCPEIISSLYCLPKQAQTLESTYKIFHDHFHRPLNPGFQFMWSTGLDLVTSLTSSSVCTPSECLVTLEIRPQSHCSSPCIHFCVTPACVSLDSYFTAPFLSQPYLLTQTRFLLVSSILWILSVHFSHSNPLCSAVHKSILIPTVPLIPAYVYGLKIHILFLYFVWQKCRSGEEKMLPN